MSFSSISGKNWLFKQFDSSDVRKFSELYSLNETVAKLLSIRKKNFSKFVKYGLSAFSGKNECYKLLR